MPAPCRHCPRHACAPSACAPEAPLRLLSLLPQELLAAAHQKRDAYVATHGEGAYTQLATALETIDPDVVVLVPRLLKDADALLHSTAPLEAVLPRVMQLTGELQVAADACCGLGGGIFDGGRRSTSILHVLEAVECMAIGSNANFVELAESGALASAERLRYVEDLALDSLQVLIPVPGAWAAGAKWLCKAGSVSSPPPPPSLRPAAHLSAARKPSTRLEHACADIGEVRSRRQGVPAPLQRRGAWPRSCVATWCPSRRAGGRVGGHMGRGQKGDGWPRSEYSLFGCPGHRLAATLNTLFP